MVKFNKTIPLFLKNLKTNLVDTQFIPIFVKVILWKNYLKIPTIKAMQLNQKK